MVACPGDACLVVGAAASDQRSIPSLDYILQRTEVVRASCFIQRLDELADELRLAARSETGEQLVRTLQASRQPKLSRVSDLLGRRWTHGLSDQCRVASLGTSG
jgi:hypothetical protein